MKKIIALALVLSVFNINNVRAEDALPPECDLSEFECTHDCDEYRPYMDQLHEYYHNRYLCLQNAAHIMLKTEEKQKLYDELIQSFREVLWDFDAHNIYNEGSVVLGIGHLSEAIYTPAREELQILVDNYLRGKKYDDPSEPDFCELMEYVDGEDHNCYRKIARIYTQNYIFNGYPYDGHREIIDFRPEFKQKIDKAMDIAEEFYKAITKNEQEYKRELELYNIHLYYSLLDLKNFHHH